MFGLTSPALSTITIIGTVLTVAAIAVLVTRDGPAAGASIVRRLAVRAAPVVILVLIAQAGAVMAIGLAVNNSYGFYTSWTDLMGGTSANTPIQYGSLLRPGQGVLKAYTVHNHTRSRDDRILVWTPQQYNDPAYANQRLPVVMFLPGQPSGPATAFKHFHFGEYASRLINSGKVRPFVAVFPTLMIAPPRDTECTNIAGGPQAENWLDSDVPAFLAQRYRVQPRGRSWTVMGWSTGGFCAAKLLTAHPTHFSSAASFGGYYRPIIDSTTGNLFDGRTMLADQNSPLWLYRRDVRHGGLGGSRLLLIAGIQDKEAWPQTQIMLNAARADPAVGRITFPFGGHNYVNYRHYLSAALTWAALGWPK